MTPLDLIKSDFHRYTRDKRLKSVLWQLLRNRSLRFSIYFRLASHSNSRLIRIAAKVALDRISRKTGIQIPVGTQIGPGLYIGHGISVVVHPKAVIGKNCNLSQFTTIGSNRNTPARIGDNVYIGPNVCIVENVTVGANAIIGAGSVVVKDVPPNRTVAGNPAKVISDNCRDLTQADLWLPSLKPTEMQGTL